MELHLKLVNGIVYLMENRFSFLGYRFGLDPILSAFPVFGNIFATFIALYIVWIAMMYKVPKDKISQMLSNIVIDFILGLIPVVGNISDIFFKSNTKNLEILRKHKASEIIEGQIF